MRQIRTCKNKTNLGGFRCVGLSKKGSDRANMGRVGVIWQLIKSMRISKSLLGQLIWIYPYKSIISISNTSPYLIPFSTRFSSYQSTQPTTDSFWFLEVNPPLPHQSPTNSPSGNNSPINLFTLSVMNPE